MKNIYWKNFKNLRSELKITLYISAIIILLVDFIFANEAEIIPLGYNLGLVLTKLSYSYISALLFYFLVVHYKRQDEKRKYYGILNEQLNIFLTEYKRVFQKIYDRETIPTLEEFEEETFRDKLNIINPQMIYPGVQYLGAKLNWIQHILTLSMVYKQETDKIFENSTFIDIELVIILNNINNNKLFVVFKSLTHFGTIGNESLGNFYENFYDFIVKIDALKKYLESEVQKYL